MNIKNFTGISENEKPLDNILENGGFTSIFQTIGCVGDSLSSGELETNDKEGVRRYFDLFEYSWGQYISKMTGAKVYNFSRGGMTAKEYMESFGDQRGFWNTDYVCDAYILALGVNDLFGLKMELGSISDIDVKDYKKNKPTFAGYYAQIVQRLRMISHRSKLFFVTMPKEPADDRDALKDAHAALMYDFANLFGNAYVVDLRKYAPVNDDEYKRKFYGCGHLNTAGYYLTAVMIASYIDYIVRSDFEKFADNGLKNLI